MAGMLTPDPGKIQVLASKSVGFADDSALAGWVIPPIHDVKHATSQGALVSPGAGTRPQRMAPTKHASMLSIGKPASFLPQLQGSSFQLSQQLGSASNAVSPKAEQPPQTHSTGQLNLNGLQPSGRKKSVSRSISTYFKHLFKAKTSDDGEDSGASSPASSSSRVFSESQGQLTVASSAKSSTAALEHEVAAAMKRAQSITGRHHAPSTLLTVSRELPPKMARPVWNLRDYAVVEKMYTGYASNVYKAFCKYSGETVCLKSYSLGNLCELNRFQIFREVKLHSDLSHEHVIKLFGAFQQADQVVLVQEFAEAGDLFNLLQKYGGRLPERTAVELVMYPFLSVINYLHSNGIAHRDIKPENILFTADMRLKLCDFGLAINMNEERAVTRAGTLEYMAPEVLNCPFKNKPEENKENLALHYSYHVDTWAAGVLTYELLVGVPPFSDKQRNMVEDKIRMEVPQFPSKMSDLAKDFITRALEKNPMCRPSILDMVGHRWIRTLRRSMSVRQLQVTSPGKMSAGSSHGGAMTPCHEGDDEGMSQASSGRLHSLVTSPVSMQASPMSGMVVTHLPGGMI